MNILGYDYTVVIERDHNGAMGRCVIAEQIIRVSPDQAQQLQESTVLHEIMESLVYHLNIEFKHDKHDVIMPLEAGLYQVLTGAGVDLSPLLKGAKKIK